MLSLYIWKAEVVPVAFDRDDFIPQLAVYKRYYNTIWGISRGGFWALIMHDVLVAITGRR